MVAALAVLGLVVDGAALDLDFAGREIALEVGDFSNFSANNFSKVFITQLYLINIVQKYRNTSR